MYLAIILMPLVGSIISGFFGRKIGVKGSHLITCSSIILTTMLALIAFIETALNNISNSIYLFRWVDSESLNAFWGFNFDSLTVSMLIPVLIVSSLVHLYSIGYMSHDPHNQRFFSYLSLFTFMMIILVTANNYLLMFVGWEGVGICSYLLVSFWFTRIPANQSSISAILTNRVGDCLLTIGMFAIIWTFGNLDYATVFSSAPFINDNIITIIGICLLIGAMAKSSQIGLHVWLPMAMEGPTPVSALIHAATMVTAGVYLLIRSSPLIEYSSTVLLWCLWIGAITSVFSSLIGLFQQDIKKVIAYSTMSQLGLMVVAVGLSCYSLALFHLVNHAFYKALLFLAAGAVIHGVQDNQDFRKYGGLKQFLPLSYSVMLIASLSLVAFPFMTGFYSKDFILESSYGQYHLSSVAVYYIATIGAMFTTLYSVKTLYLTFITNPNGPTVNYKHVHEGNIYMSLPLVILALFSIFFGFVTKDMFIGLGSDLFSDNSIFIHPTREIMINTEFAVPTFYKLLPLVFTISLTIISIIISGYLFISLMYFKFSRLGYNIFSFFNLRFLIELIYNKYITEMILELGGQTTKVLDKGAVEHVGPYGIEKGLGLTSKNLSNLDEGIVTTYAVYILTGGISYILISYLALSNNTFIILMLLSSIIVVVLVDKNMPVYVINPSEALESSIFKRLTINKIISILIGGIITTLVFGTIGFLFALYFGIEIDLCRVYENIWYFLGGGISLTLFRSTLAEIIHYYLDIYFGWGKFTMTLDSPDSPDKEIKNPTVITMDNNNASSSNNPSSSNNASSNSDPSSSNVPTPEDSELIREAFANFETDPDFKHGWSDGNREYDNDPEDKDYDDKELLKKSRAETQGTFDDINATPFERFVNNVKLHTFMKPMLETQRQDTMNRLIQAELNTNLEGEAKQQMLNAIQEEARQQHQHIQGSVLMALYKEKTQQGILQSDNPADVNAVLRYARAKRHVPQWPTRFLDAAREGRSPTPSSPSSLAPSSPSTIGNSDVD